MKKNILYGLTAILSLVTIWVFFLKSERLGTKVERYKPMAEKLRTHCHFVALSLRNGIRDLDETSGTVREAAAGNIDLFVRTTEQIDTCLDSIPDKHPDNLPCMLNPSNDCRREFAKFYLGQIPERYQKSDPID